MSRCGWFFVGMLMSAALVSTLTSASEPSRADPELLLSLSFELSTEPGNRAAIVGRLQRTQLFKPGDSVDISLRVGDLRRELVSRYIAPTSLGLFSTVSHELRVGEYRQFVTAERKLATAQAAYRNLWARGTAWGALGVGWGAEALRIESNVTLAPYIADYVASEGPTSHSIPVFLLWTHDRRAVNSVLPSGHVDQINVEWGTPLGNTTYTKVDAMHESYWRFGSRVSGGFSITAGAVRGLDGHLTPIGKRFYGGGVGSVRGYENGALGPVDISGASMGADRKLTGNAEILWHALDIGPTPIIVSAFADHGRFYRAQNSAGDNASAASYGLGLSVPMAFGIVRFSFADPTRETARAQRFQFDARANWR